MAFNDAVARLTRARWESENHKHCDVWKTCRDADLVFSTDVHVDRAATANNVPGRVNVYIGDMYSAMNASFLSEKKIRVVVNMMGPPDTVDEYNKFYGPGCHWTQDKQAYEKDFMSTDLGQPEFGQPEYQNSVEEKYMREPLAFYRELNVAYVEETSADAQWNAIERHFPSVIRRVWAHVVRLYHSIDCDVAERPQIQSEINILFHCYGGRNRSASNAIAFIFWLCLYQGGERLTMPEVMERVIRRRPMVIMKGKENRENFTRALFSFAETLEPMNL